MAYEAKKTEQGGPKRGNGAYWGYKWEAKRESNRIRRENSKRENPRRSSRLRPTWPVTLCSNPLGVSCHPTFQPLKAASSNFRLYKVTGR